ncbi:hypothetical protein NP493_663g02044 [Ridgeia piscesae]|uniref:Uncharacterized protein n=1 Tax=Ridgeia piscesae TaxID=27915 RepID=A0AAD9KS15_RIDPI|nr:hypothetical protein NP493_663g02044 [Ridgeia piscesae]
MCPCGLKARYTMQSCCPLSYTEAFMMRHLRSIMRITWMYKVTKKEILERTGLPSMEDLLIRKNLRWTGHLVRISPDRLPKQVLYSLSLSLTHTHTHKNTHLKDTIKRSLKARDIKSLSQHTAER